MKKIFLKNFRTLLAGSLLVAATVAISLTQSGCGPDTTTPPSPVVTPTVIEEYLILDGKRYEGKDFYKKSIGEGNQKTIFSIELGPNYPVIEITHERDSKGDTLIAHTYEPADGSSSDDNFGWEVYFFGAYGPQPIYCNFSSQYQPTIPHGKYELKKINGKYVSTFGKVQMKCGTSGGNGTDMMVVEGQVIWEKKN